MHVKFLRFGVQTFGEARFIRQQGSPGRYGHVALQVEETDVRELEMVWMVPAASIPEVYREAVFRGISSLFEAGAKFDGYFPGKLCVKVVGGSQHETDSNESSYFIAAAMAFINAVESANASETV
jgi:elongation factor G